MNVLYVYFMLPSTRTLLLQEFTSPAPLYFRLKVLVTRYHSLSTARVHRALIASSAISNIHDTISWIFHTCTSFFNLLSYCKNSLHQRLYTFTLNYHCLPQEFTGPLYLEPSISNTYVHHIFKQWRFPLTHSTALRQDVVFSVISLQGVTNWAFTVTSYRLHLCDRLPELNTTHQS